MMDCYSCGKKIPVYEFGEYGGVCKFCGTEIRKIYANGGTSDDVNKFMREQREKRKMTVVNEQ